jgi:hypothetical protein
MAPNSIFVFRMASFINDRGPSFDHAAVRVASNAAFCRCPQRAFSHSLPAPTTTQSRAHRPRGWIPWLECAPVGEKRVGLNRWPPSPRLWALNAPGPLPVGHRGISGGGVEPCAVATRLSSGQHRLDLIIWRSRRNADGPRGAGAPSPAWRAPRLRAAEAWILGHDVSKTGSQTLGRMMLSITTMVPV